MSDVRQLLDSYGFSAIPEDWLIVRVSDLLASERPISVGVMYPGNNTDDGIPLIRAADLAGHRINPNPDFKVSQKVNLDYKRTILEGGELLISLVGDVGRVAVVSDWSKGWNAARAIAVLRLKNDEDAEFLRLVLQSGPIQLLMRSWSNTTVQMTLNLKEVKEIPIPWPPITQRREIAAILSAFDDKIELNRRMNRTLEQMARALFKSWFVDFDPVRAKMRGEEPEGMDAETAALFPAEMDEVEGREVPKGWETKRVQDVLELAYGKALTAENRLPGNVPVYGSNGPVGFHNKALTSGPGIIVGRKGNPGFVKWSQQDFFTIDTAFYVVGKGANFSPEHAFFTLDILGLPSLGADSAVPGLNRDAAYAQSYIVPTVSVLKRFDGYATQFRKAVNFYENESAQLASLRDALLPRLLSGEVDVSGWGEVISKAASLPD